LWKKALYGATTTLLALATAEVLLRAPYFTRALTHWESGRLEVYQGREALATRYDPTLGWALRPDLNHPHFFGDGRDLVTNSHGIRARGEHRPAPPPGKRRAIALGDSFTFGHGIGNDESWPAQLDTLLPDWEVLNLGMMGYGLDQAYLLYLREGVKYEHDAVLLGLITDDFRRLLTDRGGGGFYKPRFQLQGTRLKLTNVPAPEPRGHWVFPEERLRFFLEYFALTRALARLVPQPDPAHWGDDAERSRPIGEAILTDLARRCRERGVALMIVWLPALHEYQHPAARRLRDAHRNWVHELSRQEEFGVVDLTTAVDELTSSSVDGLFLNEIWRHPNVHYHHLVAISLRESLQSFAETLAE